MSDPYVDMSKTFFQLNGTPRCEFVVWLYMTSLQKYLRWHKYLTSRHKDLTSWYNYPNSQHKDLYALSILYMCAFYLININNINITTNFNPRKCNDWIHCPYIHKKYCVLHYWKIVFFEMQSDVCLSYPKFTSVWNASTIISMMHIEETGEKIKRLTYCGFH